MEPLGDGELSKLQELAYAIVEYYDADQHHIQEAQSVTGPNGAFERNEARSGLRQALLIRSLERAAAERRMRVYPTAGGGRYVTTTGELVERHHRFRLAVRVGGRLEVSCSENGLQSLDEGPFEEQFIDFDFRVFAFVFDEVDLVEIISAPQLDVEPVGAGSSHRVVFGGEVVLYERGFEPDGFEPEDRGDPWADEDGLGDVA